MILRTLLPCIVACSGFCWTSLAWSIEPALCELQTTFLYPESPEGVAIGPQGYVYVVFSTPDVVRKYDVNGNELAEWGSTGTDPGQFMHATGIDVDDMGNVYVVDRDIPRVQKFDAAGNYLNGWGTPGTGPGNLSYPTDIAVDSQGMVYVVDPGNPDQELVHKFDASGNFLLSWGGPGSGDDQFYNPWALAVNSADEIHVTDVGNDKIKVFNPDGEFIRSWGESGSGPHQFRVPYAIDIDDDENVYVFDTATKKFDPTGNLLSYWSLSYSGSQDLAWHPSGFLFLTFSEYMITKYGTEPGCAPSILLHAQSAGGNPCPAAPTTCAGLVTEGVSDPGGGASYYVYLLANRGDTAPSLWGIECGVTYDNAPGLGNFIELWGWTGCAETEVTEPGWPASGSGIALGWNQNNCQVDEIVVGGAFYISAYDPSGMRITVKPSLQEMQVSACNGPIIQLAAEHAGVVSFVEPGTSTDSGCNPCVEDCQPATVGVGDNPGLAPGFGPAFPNPFTASTRVTFSLEEATTLHFQVFDIRGARVRTLGPTSWPPGTHSIAWDGKNDRGQRVTPGIYFLRMDTRRGARAIRLTMIR